MVWSSCFQGHAMLWENNVIKQHTIDSNLNWKWWYSGAWDVTECVSVETWGNHEITHQNTNKSNMEGCCYGYNHAYRRSLRIQQMQIGTERKVVNYSSHCSSMIITQCCVSSILYLKLAIHQGSTLEKINGVRVTLKVALMRNLWEMFIFYLQNRTKQFSPKPF